MSNRYGSTFNRNFTPQPKSKPRTVVFQLWLKQGLDIAGFIPITERPNPAHPNLFCWDYEPTEELQNTIHRLTTEYHENRAK